MSAAPSPLAVAVTPSDVTNLPRGRCRALYIGAGGNVSLQSADGAVTFVGVPTGTVLPVETTRVNATNTTATSIVALY